MLIGGHFLVFVRRKLFINQPPDGTLISINRAACLSKFRAWQQDALDGRGNLDLRQRRLRKINAGMNHSDEHSTLQPR
ncbi:hypothetical protein CWR43_00335 [Rhizobium sullae]|uniref:Uncharacterized protein n=1 Tax=Rhizobium sullae TaxID=50338 RepID=A0A2N0DHD5_RHISU|nr:hypothetical protein CWR43_00335 [Rhizobium sullae]